MKSSILLAALLAFSTAAQAEFRVPSKVFGVEDLEKAKAEAAAKNKPISILYSDKDTTCPLCTTASETMMKELGTKTVMVYARHINNLPKPVIQALEQGKFIPKVAVLDAKLERSLGMVTYESVKADSRKAFRDVEKAIREYGKAE